jgi:hypothetical protein
MKLTNTFLDSKMNLDISARLLPKNQYGYAMNIEVINPTSDVEIADNLGNSLGAVGQAGSGLIKNTLGNRIPVNASGAELVIKDKNNVTITNGSCIGACTDPSTNSIYFFITSDTEDLIVQYTDTPTVTATGGAQGYVGNLRYILRAPKPTVSGRFLNFKATNLITANLFNGFLFWTDNLNPPRMLEVALCSSYNGLGVGSSVAWDQDDITVIVKPPVTSPVITLSNDGTSKNYMKDRFLYFSYRYKYRDGRWSSMAPFSQVAFRPSTFSYNAYTGSNNGMLNQSNSCNITVATGSKRVTDIQILFKDSEFANIYIADTVNKLHPIVGSSATIPNDSTWMYKSFDNSKIYTTLPSSQLTRLFDNVPLKALAQDIIGSRLIYGNYTQYYDLKDSWNSEIVPNYTVSYVSEAFSNPSLPEASFKTNRDYQIGFLYLDDYGRSSTVITSSNSSVHVPASVAGKRNYLKIAVNHYPPSWATKYRVAIRQNREDYYNIYPVGVVQDGAYAWFRLNSSDKNKVIEGDYVVVKSDYGGINLLGKELKVIEISHKDSGGIFTISGLYMKIQYNSQPSTSSANTWSPSYSGAVLPFTNIITPTWITSTTTNNMDWSYLVKYASSGISSIVPVTAASYTKTATPSKDYRFIIEYAGATGSQKSLNYKVFNGSTYVNGTIPQVYSTAGAPIPVSIKDPATGAIIGKLTITNSLTFGPGDTLRLNVYSGVNGSTVWGVPIKPLSLLMPTNQTDQTINAGAEVTLGEFKEYLEGQGTDITTNAQAFVSSTKYVDIQEWFYEDGIYNLFYQGSVTPSGSLSQTGSNNVFFRMGTINFATISSSPATTISAQLGSTYGSTAGTSIYMMISTNLNLLSGTVQTLSAKFLMYGFNRFKVVWQKNIICLETVPKQNESPIYHECTDNLSILTITPTGGLPYKVHGGNVPSGNQSTTQGATVALWTNVYVATTYNLSFNCWAFANGVESNRIRDDFNAPTMEWSPRVFTPVENYKQETVYAGVTYSGTYNYDSPSNNLNQFNLSLGNFKQLDKSFGSVQRIKSRDTDLVVLQQDKVSKVLFGKNLLSDSAGGGSISSIPEVLGTQVAYEGQFGISSNPESFAQWGDDMYFTDSQRGAVLRLNNQGLFDISTQGMKSFFNHNFKIQPDTIKIGAYDPYYKRYVLRETDRSKGSNSVTVVNTGGTTPTQAYAYVPFQEPITTP